MSSVQKNDAQSKFVRNMFIALVAGVVCGFGLVLLRENVTAESSVWTTVNNLLFRDITARGNEKALGLFYIAGQMFIRSLQLIIVPMVFTSIILAICRISDMSRLKRISVKTLCMFLLTSVLGLIVACVFGYTVYRMGMFNIAFTGLEGAVGKTSSNPMAIILNIIPSNIAAVFSTNSSVLSIVFLAVAVGVSMNILGHEKTAAIKKLVQEVNDIIVVFLNYVVTKFGPVAIFMLLTRTFASYGVTYIKPAATYMAVTTVLLFAYLLIVYPILVAVIAKINPMTFVKKISKVAVFGFSTSSSAAVLPLNLKTNVEDFGVNDEVASFVLPLGMTINMDGTAIMQVVATLFIAGCAGYEITVPQLVTIAVLALVASVGTPAAPGAGGVILFTILSGIGLITEPALAAYALILAINRPIEMLVTALNVVGDAVASIVVAKSENKLDTDIYNK